VKIDYIDICQYIDLIPKRENKNRLISIPFVMFTQMILSMKNKIWKCLGSSLSMLITLIFCCTLRDTRAHSSFLQNMFADELRDYVLALRWEGHSSYSKYWSRINYFYLLILSIAHISCYSYIIDEAGNCSIRALASIFILCASSLLFYSLREILNMVSPFLLMITSVWFLARCCHSIFIWYEVDIFTV
jgi:hypothetical protein